MYKVGREQLLCKGDTSVLSIKRKGDGWCLTGHIDRKRSAETGSFESRGSGMGSSHPIPKIETSQKRRTCTWRFGPSIRNFEDTHISALLQSPMIQPSFYVMRARDPDLEKERLPRSTHFNG
ncbi:phosphoribosylamine--glycine ligase [Striga asiatica]|uniref:Phosphoribosylamine--glycine ligase n=1 Tax=Striga asiatica TaxID=4170 RepID=A0A5A7PZY7_STRAF|nr:phosphoribosylamine--glycine ligase [Striga asiatica]